MTTPTTPSAMEESERCLAHGTDYQECPACYRAERNALARALSEREEQLIEMRKERDRSVEYGIALDRSIDDLEAQLRMREREHEIDQERISIAAKMRRYIAFVLTGDEDADSQLAADRAKAALEERVREVKRLREGIDKARRESASDPDSRWARNATIILDTLLTRRPAPMGPNFRSNYPDPAHDPSLLAHERPKGPV